MNSILYLKELWRRRALVAASLAVAAAISVFAIFSVGVFPPSISKRNDVSARGSIELLVDAPHSPIADVRHDLTGLTARASVLARYMAGGNVIRRIARATGIPVKQIDVAGPTPLPGEAPGADQPPTRPHPYGISVTQAEELPILNVSTRAPTVRDARALAAAAPAAIRQVVRSIQEQEEIRPGKRVEFRVLGPAQAGTVDAALGMKVALLLFVVILAIFITLILAVPRLVAAWRAAESDPRSRRPQHQAPPDIPAVLRLPAGLPAGGSDVAETGDPEANRVGQQTES